jgi:glyoxylase-like metal-dependent hydrolase (beta-lactamase superfamily II)
MIHIKGFTFNPFQENTYLLVSDTKDCIIVDPGCFTPEECQQLQQYIDNNGLKPVMLLLTHGHIDHVFGNKWVFDTYGLKPHIHELDVPLMHAAPTVGKAYGIPVEPSPEPAGFLADNQEIVLGTDKLKVLFAPGHAPGHVCFYHEAGNWVVGGDVLFQMSIGRTDLPGGDYDTLVRSIQTRLFTLPDETIVYSGHGPETSIGAEKMNNPFVGIGL